MGYIIAIAGKGGTGKTTISALIVRAIKERKLGSILAVDADPNSNLAEALGVERSLTIGQILDGISRHPQEIPSGMPKDTFIELQVQAAITEGDGFDLLSMGRPEGPGCYCYVNNSLRNLLDKLIHNYDYILIDNEAGLEHLSRRVSRRVDALVVVATPSPIGLKAAKRIIELVNEIEIVCKKRFLLVNCTKSDFAAEQIQDIGLDYLGQLSYDAQVEKFSLDGLPLMDLDNNGISMEGIRRIGEKIWLCN